MPLLEFPSELIEQIVNDPELESGHLRNLALTCRHLQPFAENALYRKISWDHDFDLCAGPRKPNSPHRRDAHRSMKSMAQLLRTIVLHRPEFALKVRSVSLPNNTVLVSLCGCSVYGPLSIVDFKSILYQTRMPGPYLSKWRTELDKGICSNNVRDKVDCLLSLLLAHLPNLKHLHLGQGFTADRFNFSGLGPSQSIARCLGTLIRCAVACQNTWPRFGQNLQEVTMEFSWRNDDNCTSAEVAGQNRFLNLINHNYILPFFFLPRVREIEIAVPNPKCGSPPFVSDMFPDRGPSPMVDMTSCPPPRPHNLRSLKVNRIREDYLKQLLAWMPHLQELDWTCDYGLRQNVPAFSSFIDLDAVCSALSCVQTSLTSLTIRTSSIWNVPGHIRHSPTLAGSIFKLQSFPSLKRLNLPIPLLFTWPALSTGVMAVPTCAWEYQLGNILPRSLEHLTLSDNLFLDPAIRKVHWYESLLALYVLEAVIAFVERSAADVVPCLRRITIELPDLPPPTRHLDPNDRFEHIRALLRSLTTDGSNYETSRVRKDMRIAQPLIDIERARRRKLKLACDAAGIALDMIIDPIAVA